MLEILRAQNRYERDAIVKLLAHRRWTRLPTEAESESIEFVELVAKQRSAWMREIPDHVRVSEFRRFWSDQVWQEAIRRPARMRNFQLENVKPVEDLITRNQIERRDPWRKAGFAQLSVDDVYVSLDDRGLPEDIGLGVDPADRQLQHWRVLNALSYWHHLVLSRPTNPMTGKGSTYHDWVGAFVSASSVAKDRTSFNRLWYYEAKAAAVPRNWIRVAVDLGQLARRIGPGNPVDAQLSSYLLDCDLFVSADMRFVEILLQLGDVAPFTMPRIVGTTAGPGMLKRLEHILLG